MGIRWLVRTMESKAYLREYDMVGVRWCMYSCKCTWIYMGKLNTLNKTMSLQWPNNWEPNIFNEQHNTPSCLFWHTRSLECRTSNHCVSVICISFPSLTQRPGLSPFYDPQDSNVSSSLGYRMPAAVNLSHPHTNSILLTRTKVYGYTLNPILAEIKKKLPFGVDTKIEPQNIKTSSDNTGTLVSRNIPPLNAIIDILLSSIVVFYVWVSVHHKLICV